jgi:hypothetical protein
MRLVHALLVLTLTACRENPSTLGADPGAATPSSSAASKPSPQNEGDVGQRLQKALAVGYPDATVTPGAEPKTFVIRWPDGRSVTVPIDKVERECAATPNDCDSIMRRAARAAGIPAKSDAGAADASAPVHP